MGQTLLITAHDPITFVLDLVAALVAHSTPDGIAIKHAALAVGLADTECTIRLDLRLGTLGEPGTITIPL